MSLKKNAEEVLNILMDGNKRYIKEKSLHNNQDKKAREENKDRQKPYAVVVTCGDSRVPPEIIFDTGIGEIFVIRSAGHTLSASVMGSIEYAITDVGCKLVLIIGHTNCGAVNTALKTYKNGEFSKLSENLKSIISPIHKFFDTEENIDKKSNFEIIKSYVNYELKSIQKDDCFMKKLKDNNVVIVGGIYDILTGEVNFFDTAYKNCFCCG